jgi:hypothetical protein
MSTLRSYKLGFATLAPQVVFCRGENFINYRMECVLEL